MHSSGQEEEEDSNARRKELVRSVDSEILLNELARRGISFSGDEDFGIKRKSTHIVGSLREMSADGVKRKEELDAALLALGTDSSELVAGPPLKAYNTYLRPRSRSQTQTVENAAHQIAFLNRHEKARRETQLRNTDNAARARRAAGLESHPLILILDNIRSAENVGSIFRTADCARCQEIITCGFTPNPLSTSKIQKTAFGAEESISSRHISSTKEALLDLKQKYQHDELLIWALETHDTAITHINSPLPTLHHDTDPSDEKGEKRKRKVYLALLLGNEVTGVDLDLLHLVDAVVEIPTFGSKNSMNVAVAAGIVIYDVLRRWSIVK